MAPRRLRMLEMMLQDFGVRRGLGFVFLSSLIKARHSRLYRLLLLSRTNRRAWPARQMVCTLSYTGSGEVNKKAVGSGEPGVAADADNVRTKQSIGA